MKNKEKELIKIHEQILELNQKKYIVLKEYIEEIFEYINKNNLTIKDIKNIVTDKNTNFLFKLKEQGNSEGIEIYKINYDLKLPIFLKEISKIDFDFLK